jgi:hypothetical protein
MDSYNLQPKYSTYESTGRCVKCLAEHEMNTCLMSLLRGDDQDNEKETKKKYEVLMTFLKSPAARELIDESEKLLSEGKKVNVKLYIADDRPRYELEIIN